MDRRKFIIAGMILLTLVLIMFIFGYWRGIGRNGGDKFYCSDERDGKFCIQLYAPVCGWYNESIKCIKYPCAETYNNGCFACIDEKVDYYTKGECPR